MNASACAYNHNQTSSIHPSNSDDQRSKILPKHVDQTSAAYSQIEISLANAIYSCSMC